MDEWMGGWMDGWIDGWVDEWMEKEGIDKQINKLPIKEEIFSLRC